MNIVHLSTNDNLGGAARSAYRLHKGLQRIGHTSSMLVSVKRSQDASVIPFLLPMDLASRVRRRFRRNKIERNFAKYEDSRPAGYELFSDDRSQHECAVAKQIPSCDVINLHWVAGFLDYQAFFAHVFQSTSIVWTLHDMNPVTGGCHYDLGCGRYVTRCGSCPQLGSSREHDLTSEIWERKLSALAQANRTSFRIVTPSHWLAGEVKRSSLMADFGVDVIPYGIDVAEFAPRDRRFAREVLGLPQEAKVVLFLADLIDNRRKGFELLANTMPACAKEVENLVLMSLGQNAPTLDTSIPWIHLGSMNDDRFLSLIYSAADVFVIPSLQDNLPNTVLEAMACGIPIVGFAIGGIPDMVRHDTTGLLVPPYDVQALQAAIVDLLRDKIRRQRIGTNCRRIAVEEYSLEVQAQRYGDLYKSLC